jgi:hypothetical protein
VEICAQTNPGEGDHQKDPSPAIDELDHFSPSSCLKNAEGLTTSIDTGIANRS